MNRLRRGMLCVALALVASSAHAGLAKLPQDGAAEPAMVYFRKLEQIGAGTVHPLFSAADFALAPASCKADRAPKMHGLLIGAASPGPAAMRLRGPENDVRLMATALDASGAAAADVHALVGADADREGVRTAALRIAAELGCGDRVVVYFGGHSAMPDASVFGDSVAAAREEAGGSRSKRRFSARMVPKRSRRRWRWHGTARPASSSYSTAPRAWTTLPGAAFPSRGTSN